MLTDGDTNDWCWAEHPPYEHWTYAAKSTTAIGLCARHLVELRQDPDDDGEHERSDTGPSYRYH